MTKTLSLAVIALAVAVASCESPSEPSGSARLAALRAATPAHARTLAVDVTGVPTPGGTVRVGLYADPDTFPDTGKSVQARSVVNTGGVAHVVFDDVPDGTYALACYYDQNDNGKMDTTLFGAPAEAYAFSNDAKPGLFGPPSFKAASFPVRGQTDVAVTMKFQQ